MNQLTLSAPAKINLTLDILGARPDGYHEMEMVMQSVSLCDEVTRPPSQPARKDFCRAKMPCGGQSVTNLLLGRKIVSHFTNQ